MVADCRQVPLLGVCVGLDFQPDVANMPMLLRHFQCLNATELACAAKVVAAAFGKAGESCCEVVVSMLIELKATRLAAIEAGSTWAAAYQHGKLD
jgi:hypothetical protein